MGCLLSDRGKFPATNFLIDENRRYLRKIVIGALPGIGSGGINVRFSRKRTFKHPKIYEI